MNIIETLQQILSRLANLEMLIGTQPAEEEEEISAEVPRRNSGPRPDMLSNARIRPYIESGLVTRDGRSTALGRQVFEQEGMAWCCRKDHGTNGPDKLSRGEFYSRENGRPRCYCKTCDYRETKRTYEWYSDKVIALPRR